MTAAITTVTHSPTPSFNKTTTLQPPITRTTTVTKCSLNGTATENDFGSQFSSPGQRTFLVYLIRHGEACHNVREKQARMLAKELAIQEGFDPASDEVQARMKEAQTKVLDDPQYFDAPLTDAGRQQGHQACDTIQSMAAAQLLTGGLPFPAEVLVSPLQRTLQTAAAIFPGHPNIRVREELRERLTGRPADNRLSSLALARRTSFQRFSFQNLRNVSLMALSSLVPSPSGAELDAQQQKPCEHICDICRGTLPMKGLDACLTTTVEEEENHHHHPFALQKAQLRDCHFSSSRNADTCVEDAAKLSHRTLQLFELLLQSHHHTVAIVTHKAYLRELERGPLNRPEATEFSNCEVRVYQLSLDTFTQELISAVRVR